MATNNGPKEMPRASGDLPPAVPPMPSVQPHQLYRGTPYILLEDLPHSVGWQDYRNRRVLAVLAYLGR